MFKKLFGKRQGAKEKKKVLSIEDDALLAKVLIEGLTLEGYDVLNVPDGLIAIDETKKYNPDIILLDLILPGIDGFEVLKQLKADSATKDIPVIVVSNLGSVADVKSVKALGAEEYFIKANSEMEEIFQTIKKRIS